MSVPTMLVASNKESVTVSSGPVPSVPVCVSSGVPSSVSVSMLSGLVPSVSLAVPSGLTPSVPAPLPPSPGILASMPPSPPQPTSLPVDSVANMMMPGTLLAQQLPPLNPFTGDEDSGSGEVIEEWLERFELVAAVGQWDQPAKLANLVTRLKGPAFAFFRSCSADKRSTYTTLVAELKKRFTPVHIGAVQTSLFHDHKQSDAESVDTYAQDLRRLFHKAYPCSQRGGQEAEQIAQTVLTSQFVAGLRTSIKAKLAGSEGSFDELLAKAHFEEAKSRELRATQLKQNNQSKPANTGQRPATHLPTTVRYTTHGQTTRREQQVRSDGARSNPRECFNCGSTAHLANQCPHRHQTGPPETPGQEQVPASGQRVAHITGNHNEVTRSDPPQESVAELREKLKQAEVRDTMDKACATLQHLEAGQIVSGVRLGPTLKTQVLLQGEETTALLDTGSPVTIVSLEHLLQIFARNREPGTTPEQWRRKVEERLQPTTLTLHNYGGDQLNIV